MSTVPKKPRPRRMQKRDFLGYCGKCGRDVAVDFCGHCGQYVQPSPNDKASAEKP